jgi:hypothetical protein
VVLGSGNVDWDSLLQVAWTSALAGAGGAGLFALAVYGANRALDLSRIGRVASGAVFAAISVAAMAGVAALVLAGLLSMTDD